MSRVPRSLHALTLVAVLALLALLTPGFSSATFTSHSESTAQVRAAADWTPPSVEVAGPGAAVRAAVTVAVVASDAETGIASVVLEVRSVDSDDDDEPDEDDEVGWRVVCTDTSAPWSCLWDTTRFPDGAYTLRARATDKAGYTSVSDEVDTTVDNTAPMVTMRDPGTPLSGSRTFSTSASDDGTGIATVAVQYSRTGSSTWQTLCTTTTDPYTCRVATSQIPDGTYSFRAVASDIAGNTTTSAPVANRVVDNTVSSVSIDAPDTLVGTTSVGASASSTAGVASVRIQYAAAGSSTWTTLCTDTTSPYSCSWDTTAVSDGRYDLRAILVDGQGRSLPSATSSHLVDNVPFRGVDVQSTNGGWLTGRIENGDSFTLTYSSEIQPSRVLTGWTGASRAVTVRVRDGALIGGSSTDDTLDVLSNGASVKLGSVTMHRDVIRSAKVVQFSATMTAGTVRTASGVQSTVTVRLGPISSGSIVSLYTAGQSGAMTWTPSSAVLDLSGRPCSTATVTESGALDRDF